MPTRTLPPPSVRAIRKNQETISKRNMAVDAGKSAYVRGKYNGLVEVPKGKPVPGSPEYRRLFGRDRSGTPIGKAEAERKRAIKTNQGIVSARNMAADAGRSTYVRGKNNGLVAVSGGGPRRIPGRPLDPGMTRRGGPVPTGRRQKKQTPPPTRKGGR